uniref:Uncharacterized protein n=1 Tax=viral metagenome TaxID=1070528 RepID=A0A6M3ILC7_9ZZZZ
MITIFDIYVAFRKAQSNYINRPYRLPKDFDLFLEKRLNEKNKKALELITKYFNTKWFNIDIDRYFDYGFELFGKSFTYSRFFNGKLIQYYIDKDKNLKRDIDSNNKNIIRSIKFVNEWLKNKQYKTSPLLYYSLCKDGKTSIPILHYIKDNIDKMFLTFLINSKYLIIEEHEKMQIPYVMENYRLYVSMLDNKFIHKVLNKLLEK